MAWEEHRNVKRRSTQESEAMLRILSQAVTPLLIASDIDSTRHLMRLEVEQAGLSMSCLYDDSSRLIAGASASSVEQCPPLLPAAEAARTMTTNIESNGIRLGSLLVTGLEAPTLIALLLHHPWAMGAFAAALLAAAVLTSVIIETQLIAPLLEIGVKMQAVGKSGDFSVRLASHHRDDELGELVESLNSMLATLESNKNHLHRQSEALDVQRDELVQEQTERELTEQKLTVSQKQLFQAQKMESIGRLAGGIAHDFNNLVTVILGSVDLVSADLGSPSTRSSEHLKSIRLAARQAGDVTRQLLTFACKQTPKSTPVDLKLLLGQLELLLPRLLGEDVVARVTHDSPLCPVLGDQTQLMQVLVNLATNSRDAMPRGGEFSIHVSQVAATGHSGERVRFVVTDTGTGFGDDVLDHLFEPFFTTKELGIGTGLGLATSYGIISQFGGSITADNRLEGGARFVIDLPRASQGKSHSAANHPSGDFELSTGRILLVEDDPLVRSTALTVLTRSGYEVVEAESPSVARERFADSGPFDLILCDVVLPEMPGPELCLGLRRESPDLPILFVSGYAPERALSLGTSMDLAVLLQKPYTRNELLTATYRVLHMGRERIGSNASGSVVSN